MLGCYTLLHFAIVLVYQFGKFELQMGFIDQQQLTVKDCIFARSPEEKGDNYGWWDQHTASVM